MQSVLVLMSCCRTTSFVLKITKFFDLSGVGHRKKVIIIFLHYLYIHRRSALRSMQYQGLRQQKASVYKALGLVGVQRRKLELIYIDIKKHSAASRVFQLFYCVLFSYKSYRYESESFCSFRSVLYCLITKLVINQQRRGVKQPDELS